MHVSGLLRLSLCIPQEVVHTSKRKPIVQAICER